MRRAGKDGSVRRVGDGNLIAFRLGQLDVIERVVLASPALFSAEMRESLALLLLQRAWQQYGRDRGIAGGGSVIGSEATAERDAFLSLLESILPERGPLRAAIALVRQVAIRPMASEAIDAAALFADSRPVLEAVVAAVADERLPGHPLDRLLALVEQFRFSLGDERDTVAGTARTPCWAINLAAVAQGVMLAGGRSPLPCPALIERRSFRADLDDGTRQARITSGLLDAMHDLVLAVLRVQRAAEVFLAAFPEQRGHSRLCRAWLLLFALDGLTPAQAGRALGATKAGAGKLLRQLEAGRLVRGSGPFAPYGCAFEVRVPMPVPEMLGDSYGLDPVFYRTTPTA